MAAAASDVNKELDTSLWLDDEGTERSVGRLSCGSDDDDAQREDSLWTPSAESFAFVSHWKRLCQGRHCEADLLVLD